MNKYLPIALLLLCGCESTTNLGPCVGIQDDDLKNPTLTYKVSVTNVIVGTIFVETAVVPVYVALKELYCPVAVKAK